jgi:glycosyltransferase involved in cell wall biosynthesis
VRALVEDPTLMFPRLVLNHRAWIRTGPVQRATHVASHPLIAYQLRQAGARMVYEIANVSTFDSFETVTGITSLPIREHGTTQCAFVGHAHPVKGVLDLLEAFARAAPRRPELRLLLALSADRDNRAVTKQIERLDISDRVTLRGLVSVRQLLAETDALVLPYRTTITTTLYPSLLLEAAAAHCPVVLSRLPELEPAVDYASPSILPVQPRSVESLTDALLKVRPRAGAIASPFLLLPSVPDRVDAMVGAYEQVAAHANAGAR